MFLPKVSVNIPPCGSLVCPCVCALLNKTKKQVTFSRGFLLSSAAPKFSFWQHPPSLSFFRRWQRAWISFPMLSLFPSWQRQDSPCPGTLWISKTVPCRGAEPEQQRTLNEHPHKKCVFTKKSPFSRRKNNLTDGFGPTKFIFQEFIFLTEATTSSYQFILSSRKCLSEL